MLLGFATWTVLLLLATVGIYRWSRILKGRVPIREIRADEVEGKDWYKRSMRAHANCVENLPVFGAIVFALCVGCGQRYRKCGVGRYLGCPDYAIACARGLGPDEYGCIDPLRIVLRADCR